MRKFSRLFCLFVFAVGITVVAFADEAVLSSTDENSACVDYFDPGWKVTAEALFLSRGSSPPMAAAFPTVGGPTRQAFTGDRFEPGIRLSLEKFDECCNSWELGYFGLQRWNDNQTVLGDPANLTSVVRSPSLRLDDIIGGFDTSVAFSYRAQTHNAEINRWFAYTNECGWKTDWMAGARYFNFEEHLNATGIDARFGTETVNSAAFNSLFGGQVGGRVSRTWNQLNLFAIGKAGLYANNWSYRVQDAIVPVAGFPPPDINLAKNGLGIAGLLETQTGFRYQLTDAIAFTSTYTVLYVPGVALQPEWNGLERRPSNGLLLHGASVGMDYCW